METQDILSIGRCAAQAAEATDPAKAETNALKAQVDALRKANKQQAERIEILLETITGLEAERDNWRKQALEEDARANAVTVKPQAKRRGRKPKGD